MAVIWTQERVMERLEALAEPEYAEFSRKLLPGDFKVLGVKACPSQAGKGGRSGGMAGMAPWNALLLPR